MIPSTKARFFIGIAVGVVFSVVYYWIVTSSLFASPILLLGAVAIKLFAGIGMCFVRNTRPFGAGLLASMPLVVLTFVAKYCAAIFTQ